jgi:hypothetical protein
MLAEVRNAEQIIKIKSWRHQAEMMKVKGGVLN